MQLQRVETRHLQAYRPIHRAQHARRVEEDALEVLLRVDCDDPVPCGLRLGSDDGQLLLQDGIQERALARVGLSDNSHIACTTRQDTAWKPFLGLARWQCGSRGVKYLTCHKKWPVKEYWRICLTCHGKWPVKGYRRICLNSQTLHGMHARKCIHVIMVGLPAL